MDKTYILRPWGLVPCPHLENRKAGSSWCKNNCEFNSQYKEFDDFNGRTDYIRFTCTHK